MRKVVNHIINCFKRKTRLSNVVGRKTMDLKSLVDEKPKAVLSEFITLCMSIKKSLLKTKIFVIITRYNRTVACKRMSLFFNLKSNNTKCCHTVPIVIGIHSDSPSLRSIEVRQRFTIGRSAAIGILLAGLLFFASCEKGHRTDCFKGTGEIITENKSIEVPFDTIKTNGRIKVNLIQDSLNFLEISTGENLVDGIEFNVVNNTLTIEDHIRCNWVRRLDHVPLVTIHYTTLHYFSAGNYFDNYFLNVHQGDYIMLDYWTGSGITHFNGDVNEAYFVVNAGSGGFEAAGHARFCYMYHAGGSRWDMRGFDAPEVYVNTLSNNDVHVRCDSLLWCDIRRTGNVYYTGSPTQIIRNGMGSGQIVRE